MKSQNNQRYYQFNGSAALKTTKPSFTSLRIVEGGKQAPQNRFYHASAAKTSSVITPQPALLNNSQILGTYLCVFVSTAVVLAMWFFLR